MSSIGIASGSLSGNGSGFSPGMTTGIRVLVIDDEPAIRRALRPTLQKLGFEVVEASRGEEALQLMRSTGFDAVLLDINMPGIGGLATLTRLRAFAPRTPVLMLSVRDAEDDKIGALELGADDYVTKPFSTGELIARIRSAVRRAQTPIPAQDAPIAIGDIFICPTRRLVTKAGRPVVMTRKEFEILYYLMTRSGRVVTYGKLLGAVWGSEYREEIDYLRTFVHQLRKKIEDNSAKPVYLLTDPCVGYRFADNPQLNVDGGILAG